MDYEAAILYAHQRMREYGKTPDQYHFEPVWITGDESELHDGLITIPAYNEIYILVNFQNYFGVMIIADNSAFHSDALRQSGAPEFTGLINIIKTASTWNLEGVERDKTKTRPVPIEFLRVVIY